MTQHPAELETDPKQTAKYWRNAFQLMYDELALMDPPDGSGLASTLDDFVDYYDEASKFCHCGELVYYGFDGDPTHHRGMCSYCDSVRSDAYPGECGRD